MILVPFFEIPHRDRLAKNVKSLCVQVIPRSTASTGKCGFEVDYRSRATNGRSQLVAAPLSLQAKTHFLCAFYEVIWTQK